jgi:hypothetical protein
LLLNITAKGEGTTVILPQTGGDWMASLSISFASGEETKMPTHLFLFIKGEENLLCLFLKKM